MYKEYLPDIRLTHLIETYWVTDGFVEENISQRIIPDGCVDIIFDFNDDNKSNQLQCCIPDIVGTMTSTFSITYTLGQVQMLGIRFRPAGITAFTKTPVNEFTNKHINLSLVDTLFDSSFYQQLPEMDNMQQRLKHINQYFISRLTEIIIPEKQIQYAVSLIRENNGLTPIRKIASEVCLCERHFERKFKASIGVSPKFFSNVMRFQYANNYLKNHHKENLYSIAIECGYHDHSHMNKEFQKLGGIIPSDVNFN